MPTEEQREAIRQQLERAAKIAEEGSEYGERWSRIHERMAEAAAQREGPNRG